MENFKFQITYINTLKCDAHKNLSYNFSLKKTYPNLYIVFSQKIFIFWVQHKTEDRKSSSRRLTFVCHSCTQCLEDIASVLQGKLQAYQIPDNRHQLLCLGTSTKFLETETFYKVMENSTELWHLIYGFLNYQKMFKLIITITFQALLDYISIYICLDVLFTF